MPFREGPLTTLSSLDQENFVIGRDEDNPVDMGINTMCSWYITLESSRKGHMYAWYNSRVKSPVQLYLMNMELWVAAKLQCGLGNRLFQLAAAKQASEAWGLPLVFAMPYCKPSEHGDFSSIFKLFPEIPKIWKAEAEISIEQGCFSYEPLPSINPSQRVLLKGFFQAAEYVADSLIPSWDAISLDDKAGLLKRWCLESNEQRAKTVFLHVRLGDYKILPHHQVPLLGYYARAMSEFPEDTRFLVFSDSPDEARALPVFVDSERCVFVHEEDEYKSLYLMSQCGGAITANSTFSWWGAYFARQGKDIKVCMPSKWMAACAESTDTIYPNWATVIEV